MDARAPFAMIFEGKNYQLWERKVHNALARAEVLRHALKKPPPIAQRQEQWLVADRKAVAIIEDHLGDRILTELPSYPCRSPGKADYTDDDGLACEREELVSYHLLKFIRAKYGPLSFKDAQQSLHNVQREESLEEFFDLKWYTWKEAGGKLAESHMNFCYIVLIGLNRRIYSRLIERAATMLDEADETSGAELVEKFRMCLLDQEPA
ncbi:hypothetical protein BCV69DRAFT_285749 [Microstroma glucosiphilum]|uniref:Uncharacterized protein n=1 Tax=Pseudomicrostroma glucosiphilum TaxID=1684307 RepID=A0A316TXH8_9BASI|nr:hypothetical protein BCV69DRAFT_285749 [Pseudomicrostroma glucosiphilum]PWN17870.1 hypothetical protein BCV69DRAFT_285749 [Pseudomicrostroma glucosiphilum]